jgi:hypothetical protein
MPQRQLNIRSDEAYARASSLARRLGRTTTDVVVEALRRYESEVEPRNERGLTPAQQARFDRMMALSEEAGRHKLPGTTSDHRDFYDDNGLPK